MASRRPDSCRAATDWSGCPYRPIPQVCCQSGHCSSFPAVIEYVTVSSFTSKADTVPTASPTGARALISNEFHRGCSSPALWWSRVPACPYRPDHDLMSSTGSPCSVREALHSSTPWAPVRRHMVITSSSLPIGSLIYCLWKPEMTQMSTYETVVGRELRLQDRMTALRNLRPGTRLSWPEDDLSRAMFRELLSLPESIDVLQWIEVERGAAVAMLSLGRSLEIAEQMYGAQNRIVSGMLTGERERQAPQSLWDKYGTIYGSLLEFNEDWAAPKRSGDTVDDSSEHRRLVDALMRLRRKVGLPTETSPSRSQVDPGPDTLLADLLRLPDSTDPVRWLQDHRLSLAARLVLEHLLQRVVPMEDLVVSAINGSPLRSIRPRVHTRSNGRLHVKVQQIDILELGFALHLRVRFSLPRGWSSAKQPGIIRQWEGFRSIRDNAGHHYVVQVASMHTSNQMWWWHGDQTLVCWPTLEHTRELTLEAQPAYLSLYRPPTGGGSIIPLPGPSLGEVSCTAVIGE